MIPRIGTPRAATVRKYTSLEAVRAFINADDANKEDLFVPCSAVEFTERKTLAVNHGRAGTKEYAFNPHSFNQLASLLKIPTKYLESCPVTGKGGQKDQIENRMSPRLSDSFLLRVRNMPTEDGGAGIIRGILSSDFAQYDNRHLLSTVENTLKGMGPHSLIGTSISEPGVNDRQFHMRIVFDDDFDPSNDGDTHRIGFHAATSEVGDSHVEVGVCAYRLICTNGLMGWADSQILSQRHVSFKVPEMSARVQEAIGAAVLQQSVVEGMLNDLKGFPVSDPESYIESIGRRLKLSEDFIGLTQTHYKLEHVAEPTRYTVMQAYTRAAGTLPLSERQKMESRIGKLFTAALEKGPHQ